MAEKKRATPMPQVPQTKDKGTVGDPEGFHPPKPGNEGKRLQSPAGQKPGDPKTPPLKGADDRQAKEKALDKTIADSFPTSDPPSSIPDPSEDSSEDDSFAA